MFAHAQSYMSGSPELVKIADEDGKKVYNIREICDGVSGTAVIALNRCHNTNDAKLSLPLSNEDQATQRRRPCLPDFRKKFPTDWIELEKATISRAMRHRAGFATDRLISIPTTAEWKIKLSISSYRSLPNEPGSKFVYTDATFYLARESFLK